ncbi:aldolase [bacterium]|nr:aldolase [bacterium]MCG2677415.1 aldolase [bacterium]
MGLEEDFIRIGRELFIRGLIASHSGNLSVKRGNEILITRRGSMLGSLTEKDIVSAPLIADGVKAASRELVVHRAIYLATSALACVHVHPPYAIALSLIENEIVPIDEEGAFYLPKVPILAVENSIGSEVVASQLAKLFNENKIAMIKGHGSFAIGETLEEAYLKTSSLEHSCIIIHLVKTASPSLYHQRILRMKNR